MSGLPQESAMRQARLAMAAHLDALAIAQDAKSLRLDHLLELLQKRLPENSDLRRTMLLRLPPEEESRLLLDLKRSVVMGQDGRDYRLEEDTPDGRRHLLESRDVEEIAAEVLRLDALAQIDDAYAKTNHDAAPKAFDKESWWQAAFLFLAGLVFGACALAAIAIYLKKLVI